LAKLKLAATRSLPAISAGLGRTALFAKVLEDGEILVKQGKRAGKPTRAVDVGRH